MKMDREEDEELNFLLNEPDHHDKLNLQKDNELSSTVTTTTTTTTTTTATTTTTNMTSAVGTTGPSTTVHTATTTLSASFDIESGDEDYSGCCLWDELALQSNAIRFILVSFPYYLVNMTKHLWFEHPAYHHSRRYSDQIKSLCFLFILLELLLMFVRRDEAHAQGIGHMLTFHDDSQEPISLLRRFGAMDQEIFLCGGEYYRVLTQIFLHLNYQHLWSNVFWQLWYGCYYNVLFGSWNFLLIWFIGGMYGVTFKLLWMRESYVICGAEDAIHALHSAFLVWMAYHWQEIPDLFVRSYLRNCNFAFIGFTVFAALTSHYDLESSGVGSPVGGCVMGFLIGVVLFSSRSNEEHPALVRLGSDDERSIRRDSGRIISGSPSFESMIATSKLCCLLAMFLIMVLSTYILIFDIKPSLCVTY